VHEQGAFRVHGLPPRVTPIKQIPASLVLTFLSCVAAAQEGLREDHYAYEHGTYFSATYGGAAAGAEDLTWAFEIRFGKEFAENHNIRWDLVHFNEGHPETLGHRDGFGGQAVWAFEASPRLSAELGVGVALTLNSIEIEEAKADAKNAGVLTTAALRYRLGRGGYHIRAQMSHIIVHSSHSNHLYLIGFGKEFADVADELSAALSRKETIFNAFIGQSTTNSGGTESAINVTFEVQRRLARHFAVSAVFLDQGDDQVRSDRKSVGSQVLRLVPFNANWTMSAGAGLLIGNNDRSDEDHLELSGLFILRGERSLGESGKRRLYLDFTRQFSEGDLEPDGDLFRVGIGQKMGGR
jgi:hypothetical protein